MKNTNTVQQQKYDPFTSLLPESMSRFPRGLYNAFPAFALKSGIIYKGYDTLAHMIAERCVNGVKVLSVEGYHGVDWNVLLRQIESELRKLNVDLETFDIQSCLQEEKEVDRLIQPFLGGDDPLFGKRFPLGIEVFFDAVKLNALQTEISLAKDAGVNKVIIVWGPGASLIELYDEVWYVDIPKDSIQFRARKNGLNNFAGSIKPAFGEFYKRSYFIDWPALNRMKLRLLPEIDVFIDGQNQDEPVWMLGDDFRHAVREVSETPFRVRPWFMPGPWGGKFMQGHMDLDPKKPNFAWSYELIVPENGVVLENNGFRIEMSFDTLMYLENRNILGHQAAKLFKYEWPIRLDYLDTVDGGNLSTQCHPRPAYIKKNFGESFTQDETYYITNSKPDARVYLGLTDTCDPVEFRHAIERSQNEGEEVDIDKYVYSIESKPHDLFLIPSGTVHCSGKGNLVLEISATPYIYTFKIYDYLRKDLDGSFRTLNVDRAWDNIYFHRRSEYVHAHLLSKPRLLRDGQDWREYVLSDSPHFFYNIHRVEFEKMFTYETDGNAFAVNLVEGETVEVTSQNGQTSVLNYLESMIIPAAAKSFTVVNTKTRPCKMILVFIRPGIKRVNRIENEEVA